jgi:hypothetical protein
MAKFRFVGDPRHGGDGPHVIEVMGVAIGRNEFVPVPDDVAAKLATNNHFERFIEGAVEPEFEPEPMSDLEPFVAKGPRGLWYVKRGEKRVSKGFETEDEALSELDALTGGADG